MGSVAPCWGGCAARGSRPQMSAFRKSLFFSSSQRPRYSGLSGTAIAIAESTLHLGFRLTSVQCWTERGSPGSEILRDTRRDKSPGDLLVEAPCPPGWSLMGITSCNALMLPSHVNDH